MDSLPLDQDNSFTFFRRHSFGVKWTLDLLLLDSSDSPPFCRTTCLPCRPRLGTPASGVRPVVPTSKSLSSVYFGAFICFSVPQSPLLLVGCVSGFFFSKEVLPLLPVVLTYDDCPVHDNILLDFC